MSPHLFAAPLLVLAVQAAPADGLPLQSRITAEKAAATSPMTLQEVFDRGKAFWAGPAKEAAANLAKDPDLREKIEEEAAKTGGKITPLQLRRLVSIESRARKGVGTNKYGYTGLTQMGGEALKDVAKLDGFAGLTLADIDGPNEWRRNLEAGRAFLMLKRAEIGPNLEKNGVPAGAAAELAGEPFLLYLMHQQGGGGGAAITAAVHRGDRTLKANKDQLNNFPKSVLRDLKQDGHEPRTIEFYAYWLGAYAAVREQVK